MKYPCFSLGGSMIFEEKGPLKSNWRVRVRCVHWKYWWLHQVQRKIRSIRSTGPLESGMRSVFWWRLRLLFKCGETIPEGKCLQRTEETSHRSVSRLICWNTSNGWSSGHRRLWKSDQQSQEKTNKRKENEKRDHYRSIQKWSRGTFLSLFLQWISLRYNRLSLNLLNSIPKLTFPVSLILVFSCSTRNDFTIPLNNNSMDDRFTDGLSNHCSDLKEKLI